MYTMNIQIQIQTQINYNTSRKRATIRIIINTLGGHQQYTDYNAIVLSCVTSLFTILIVNIKSSLLQHHFLPPSYS